MEKKESIFSALPRISHKPREMKVQKPFVLTIFGGSGDLSRRKLLPALYHLYLDGWLPDDFIILGIGRTRYSDDDYRNLIQEALKTHSPEYQENLISGFLKHCHYHSGDSQYDSLYKELCGRLNDFSEQYAEHPLFYLAVPPGLLQAIVTRLKKFRLCGGVSKGKIVIEKPFGRDRTSAHKLNEMLLDAVDENRIYRIDHYLGKETVQNILFFRFGNSIFEPLWNHKYIDHIQITVAEDLGIEHRGEFYEQTGVVRDLVQNHILQLVALVAMEPPFSFDGNAVRDEKVKVYRSIRVLSGSEISDSVFRGQYGSGVVNRKKVRGYREEDHVNSSSNTPTYFAGKFLIDNWRWANVPFYIRTGKRLPKRLSEIYIQFQQPPQQLFGKTSEPIMPGGFILGIQPEEEIVLQFNVKYPGMGNQPRPVDMVLNYASAFQSKSRPAYERLLIDTIKGDLTLFARMDGVEAMWSIVDPIIQWWDNHPAENFPNYRAGTWGPQAVNEFIRREGRNWRV